MTQLKSYVYDQVGNMPKGNLYYLKYDADKVINELRSENEILHKQSLHKDGIIASLEVRLESCEARVDVNARYEIAGLRKENEDLKNELYAIKTDAAMATRWRKVSEELPREQEIVWVYNETHKETIKAIHRGRGMFVYAQYHSLPCSVSYWMPMSIPKAPEVV